MLTVGIFLMVGALIQVLLVFTGKTPPLEVFNFPAPTIPLGSLMPQLPGNLPISLPTGKSASFELIPAKQFNLTLNMSINFFLMGFVMNFGFKIASLGVMLLRPVVVKSQIKNEKQPQV